MLSSRFIAWQMPANQTVATSVYSVGTAPSGSRAGQREDEEGADRQRRHELGERRELQPVVEHADDEHRQRRQRHAAPTS